MDMSVNIAGVEWKNPVTVASGTFGSGEEFSEYVNLNRLGAVTTKGVANVPWSGNIYTHIHQISTSVERKTGPSLQILLLFTLLCASFSFDLQTQARQAPIPHAMRSSSEI